MPWRCAEQNGDTLIKGGRGQGTVILLNSGETGGVLSWESLRGDISHTQVRYFLDEGERISRKNLEWFRSTEEMKVRQEA